MTKCRKGKGLVAVGFKIQRWHLVGVIPKARVFTRRPRDLHTLSPLMSCTASSPTDRSEFISRTQNFFPHFCTAPVAVTSSTLDRRTASGSEYLFAKKMCVKISVRRKKFVLLCRTVGFQKFSFTMATAHTTSGAFRSTLGVPSVVQ